ncbi:hypothetical protein WN944_001155 [Citrus x changshan-huyou]|uniref:Uncharacterized protein n=1 Tax=Citrus x changshan-huyou TaxID=2935761 RepID=A0AAP0QR38_9ROSI
MTVFSFINMHFLTLNNYLPHPLDNEAFEGECLTHIRRDYCYTLATMEWLGLSHMHIYMAKVISFFVSLIIKSIKSLYKYLILVFS